MVAAKRTQLFVRLKACGTVGNVLMLWNSEVSREYTEYVSHTTDVLKTLYLHMEALENV